MPRTIDQGICLRHWDWSETSQTVSILTREHGVVRGLAKGAKREKSPFSGGIEIATRGEVAFIPRSGGLSTLTAWDLQELFPGVRASTPKFFAAMYMLDLAHQFVQEGDPHPAVFEALTQGLRSLGEAPASPSRAVVGVQWTCLVEAGVGLVLDRSVATGESLEPAGSYGLSTALGGLVVDPGAFPPASVVRVRAETVGVLRTLSAGPNTPETGDDPSPPTEATVERASRLLSVYIHHVLGRSLASAEALFGKAPR